MSKRFGFRPAMVCAIGLSGVLSWNWPMFAQDEAKANAGVVAAIQKMTAVRNELAERIELRLKNAAASGRRPT